MVELSQREGGDITIADMVSPAIAPSEILKYFEGATVFLTGGTGFLGKLFMEKLLRSCPDVKKIYILMREKKEKSIEKRFEEIFDCPMFEPLKKVQPMFTKKLEMISGDCSMKNLGIKEEDKQKIIDEVNCVFHCAATVRFDEKIRMAAYINVRATRDLLLLCKEMKHLKSVVYISTAFSNCVRKEIKEEFYEPAISGEKLLTLVETLDEEMLAKMTPLLIGKWPNTYAFTKAVAEEVVKSTGKGLPLTMVRPSVVIATVREPVAGWIDNIYGATGVLLGAALGLIRTIYCKAECNAETVPADYVINCAIAASWEVGTARGSNINKEVSAQENKSATEDGSDIPIYNYVSSVQKPINWQDFMDLADKHLRPLKSPLQVWHYCLILCSNYYVHAILTFLLHKVPAYIVDFIIRCIGKEPLLVKGYQKIDKFLTVLSYFSTQQWDFNNDNTQALWKKMGAEDKQLFEFDMSTFDWDAFFYTYARGGRVYLCKDPMDTIPAGKIKYRKLQIAHYVLCAVLLFLVYKFLMFFWNLIF